VYVCVYVHACQRESVYVCLCVFMCVLRSALNANFCRHYLFETDARPSFCGACACVRVFVYIHIHEHWQ